MGKQNTRERPFVRADHQYIPRDEHVLCHGEGCHNVIAVWALPRGYFSKSDYRQLLCSRCRREAQQ